MTEAESLRIAFEREMGIEGESPVLVFYQQRLAQLNTNPYDAGGYGECRGQVLGGHELTGSQVLAGLLEVIKEQRAIRRAALQEAS